MLVLSRKRDESIVCHPDPANEKNCLTITVVDVRGDKVRLGLQAPREWGIHRHEVWDAIRKEQELKEKKEN